MGIVIASVGCHPGDVLFDIMGSVPRRIVCDGGGARAIDAGTSELNFEEPTGDGMDLPFSLDSTS